MIVKRFYDSQLAQASYLIGCGRTGSAVVIDPNRNIAQYIDAAASEGVAITHVTETHIHADFVSGSRELAANTGATLYLSDEGDADWKYAFAAESNATLLHDGDTFSVGNVVFTVLHTPGHTPEHISFLVTDTAAATDPIAIVSGDFVFVGDVGRPDLLEKAAKIEGTMDGAARLLFASLQRLSTLPDWLQIWPGHGAGSACGKGLSAVPQSTLGYERRFNWAFSITNEDDFVAAVLEGQPEPPTYFAEMKRINKFGPPNRVTTAPPVCTVNDLQWALRDPASAMVIDVRLSGDYVRGHIPGTINIPSNKSLVTWAGWLVPYDRDLYLIVPHVDTDSIAEIVNSLALIGLDRITGVVDSGVVAEWEQLVGPLEQSAEQTAAETATALAAGLVNVIDVRAHTEWESGHIPGVPNIPVGHLLANARALPRDKPLVLQCQGGGRSAIAASLLQAHGFSNVVNMTGGIGAWEREGLPTVTGDEAVEASR